jgi:hypothetical protein
MPTLTTILTVVLLAYALVDVIATEISLIRNLPKAVWALVVIFVPIIGPISWLVFGRPRGGSLLPGTTARDYTVPHRDRRRPMAPDDDPEFLRRLSDPRDDR